MYPILKPDENGEYRFTDPTPAEAAAQCREEIQGRLDAIDRASIRPLRAVRNC
jgi:hypothetical protein